MTTVTGVPEPVTSPRASAPGAPSTFLAPGDTFPSALAELDLLELQVLHSRICRQIEQEYLADPEGPHPVTLDRCQELTAELDTRQCFLAERGPALTAAPDPRVMPEVAPAAPPVDPPSARRDTADEPGVPIRDLGQLRAGDRIEVWYGGQRHCLGTVEESCPALGVVWVHEVGDGYRRMIHAQGAELRRHAPRTGR